MFVTTVSMPGCLPDAEPGRFDELEGARSDIIRQLLWAADLYDEPTASAMSNLAEDVNLWLSPRSVTGPDGMVYEIADVPAA